MIAALILLVLFFFLALGLVATHRAITARYEWRCQVLKAAAQIEWKQRGWNTDLLPLS